MFKRAIRLVHALISRARRRLKCWLSCTDDKSTVREVSRFIYSNEIRVSSQTYGCLPLGELSEISVDNGCERATHKYTLFELFLGQRPQ